MKLIKPSFTILEQDSGIEGIYKQIERAAKVCYKSEGNITEDSAKSFIDNVLLKRGHLSPLEHGTVYIWYRPGLFKNRLFKNPAQMLQDNPYSYIIYRRYKDNRKRDWKEMESVVVTNFRVLIENADRWDFKTRMALRSMFTPYEKLPSYLTEDLPRRISAKFICSRAVAQEFTRHRTFSFMMESQRYCNYSKDKFNNNVTFIIPEWANFEEDEYTKPFSHYYGLTGNTAEALWYNSCFNSEEGYRTLLQEGRKPQEAREVLINSCKTELIMTGFIEDWKHFFELRCANNAHPEARRLAIPLREEFIKNGWL